MATWTTPVFDRTDGTATMNAQDMDRITGNLAWLYDKCVEQSIPITGSVISKTSWTRNDIITTAFWSELLGCLSNVCDAVAYTPADAPDNVMIYTNINNVERIENDCWEILAAYDHIPNINHWIGDKIGTGYLYAGDDFNAGGRYT